MVGNGAQPVRVDAHRFSGIDMLGQGAPGLVVERVIGLRVDLEGAPAAVKVVEFLSSVDLEEPGFVARSQAALFAGVGQAAHRAVRGILDAAVGEGTGGDVAVGRVEGAVIPPHGIGLVADGFGVVHLAGGAAGRGQVEIGVVVGGTIGGLQEFALVLHLGVAGGGGQGLQDAAALGVVNGFGRQYGVGSEVFALALDKVAKAVAVGAQLAGQLAFLPAAVEYIDLCPVEGGIWRRVVGNRAGVSDRGSRLGIERGRACTGWADGVETVVAVGVGVIAVKQQKGAARAALVVELDERAAALQPDFVGGGQGLGGVVGKFEQAGGVKVQAVGGGGSVDKDAEIEVGRQAGRGFGSEAEVKAGRGVAFQVAIGGAADLLRGLVVVGGPAGLPGQALDLGPKGR